MKKKIKGFSLVELMVTLIIVSMLVAALAPVITKKLKSSSVTVGSFNSNISNIEMDCSLFGEKCSLCDSVKCISCSEICEYNQALNIQECTCKNCSDLFESNCKQCSINACSLCEKGNYIAGGKCVECEAGYKCDGITRTQCQDGYYALANASECEKCTDNCANCEKYTGKCLACKTNFKLEEDSCIADSCGDLALKITLNGKDLCMTKYNISDVEGLNLPISDLTIASTATVATITPCTPSNTTFCCWKGTTATDCDDINGDYSGCTRTLCDWRAANKICESLTYLNRTWRLPTSNELSFIGAQINSISVGQGSDGLMLCDWKSGYSSARCGAANICKNAYSTTTTTCYPTDIWSSTLFDSSNVYVWSLNSGELGGPLKRTFNWAFSVRCVSDL